MPLRALSYVLSAVNVRKNYFPLAQLQIISALAIAEHSNGTNIHKARVQACTLQRVVRAELYRGISEDNDAITFLESTHVPGSDLQEAVKYVLTKMPKLSEQFHAQAIRRGTSPGAYVAAHLLVHDTVASLIKLESCNEPEPRQADRIISIGAQSERAFYAARMACRKAQELPCTLVPDTGQLFTRHVLPPYLQCREGEPTLSQITLLQGEAPKHPNASVARDLTHLKQYINQKEEL